MTERSYLTTHPTNDDWQRSANDGLALAQAGRFAEAERALRRALTLRPNYADGYCHLAGIWQAQQRHTEAEAAYRRALTLKPGHFKAANYLGTLLHSQGRLAEAEAAYRRALAIDAAYSDAAFNLANLWHDQGRLAEAASQYRELLRRQPNHLEASYNLALLCKDQGQFAEAEALFRHTIARRPDHAAALNALGILFSEQGRYAEAEPCFRGALRVQPQAADTLGNLGYMLVAANRYAEAEPLFLEALRLRPTDGHAASKITFIRRHLCAWEELERIEAQVTALATAAAPTGIVPFERLSVPGASGAEQLSVARRYAQHRYPGPPSSPSDAGEASRPADDTRLRIGYLSADFQEHPVLTQLIGVLEAHDRQRVEVFAYSYGPDRSDSVRRRTIAACDHFREVRELTDARVAERIAADRVDILVDLMGYTKGSRQGITARRPAPVIVNWLGYPGTLGEPRLADYLIGDPIVTPVEHKAHFSEKILRMPHCYLPNDRQRTIAPKPTKQAAGLPESGFVFCCFNQSFKFNPETFDIWCRLLREVPDSVLWLQAPHPEAQANLRREAAARSIAQERLLFAERTPSAEEHLGRLQLADLALDTYPYNSHSTGCDALWAGVPMVTRIGETFASRVGASLLQAVNLPELVTTTWDDYFALAKTLAADPAHLADLRTRLAQERLSAPLFDTVQFSRDLEALLLALR
jgi:protein O-GlcNAc transferase